MSNVGRNKKTGNGTQFIGAVRIIWRQSILSVASSKKHPKMTLHKYLVLCVVAVVACGGGITSGQEASAKNETLPPIAVRAPSTFVNCECQCDPHVFQHRGQRLGNCIRLGAAMVFKSGPTRPLFRLFSVFSNKQYIFTTTNQCEKMSIQYTTPRFDPTTFRT